MINEIESLIKRRNYIEALAECEKLLIEMPEEKLEILRTRAYAFARMKDYERALDDYETILETNEAAIRDYYLAAFRSLYVEQFAKTVIWLQRVLQLSAQQNDIWFVSASYFYLAYAEMKLGNPTEANNYLDQAVKASPNIALPIPHLCGMFNHSQLRDEIERQQKSFP
jgi:tetratricopeptide (TPR) repeat protein